MRAVVQIVKQAKVTVQGKLISEIASGLLVYLAIGIGDNEAAAKKMADKIINLRIFPDEKGKMNLSLKKVGGEILVVSQFTLYADVENGQRPSFSGAIHWQEALPIFELFVNYIKAAGISVKKGIFRTKMEVESINDGPVTIILFN